MNNYVFLNDQTIEKEYIIDVKYFKEHLEYWRNDIKLGWDHLESNLLISKVLELDIKANRKIKLKKL